MFDKTSQATSISSGAFFDVGGIMYKGHRIEKKGGASRSPRACFPASQLYPGFLRWRVRFREARACCEDAVCMFLPVTRFLERQRSARALITSWLASFSRARRGAWRGVSKKKVLPNDLYLSRETAPAFGGVWPVTAATREEATPKIPYPPHHHPTAPPPPKIARTTRRRPPRPQTPRPARARGPRPSGRRPRRRRAARGPRRGSGP